MDNFADGIYGSTLSQCHNSSGLRKGNTDTEESEGWIDRCSSSIRPLNRGNFWLLRRFLRRYGRIPGAISAIQNPKSSGCSECRCTLSRNSCCNPFATRPLFRSRNAEIVRLVRTTFWKLQTIQSLVFGNIWPGG